MGFSIINHLTMLAMFMDIYNIIAIYYNDHRGNQRIMSVFQVMNKCGHLRSFFWINVMELIYLYLHVNTISSFLGIVILFFKKGNSFTGLWNISQTNKKVQKISKKKGCGVNFYIYTTYRNLILVFKYFKFHTYIQKSLRTLYLLGANLPRL